MRRSRDEPFREATWEEALDFTVSEIRRIQSAHGNDAFGLLGGASLFSEKTYLVGKFARVALKTKHVDYNGRLCMVSAARRQQAGLRHRPGRQPVLRHPPRRLPADRRVERGGVLPGDDAVRVGRPRPRRRPHRHRPARDGRRPHGRHPRRPQARHRLRVLQRRTERRHPREPGRRGVRGRPHHRVGRGQGHRRDVHPGAGRRDLRDPRRTGRPGRQGLRGRRQRHGLARPGHRAPLARRRELPHRHQPLRGHRQHRQTGRLLRHPHRAGQRPRGPRARPEGRPAARRALHPEPGPPTADLRDLGHRESELPAPARR